MISAALLNPPGCWSTRTKRKWRLKLFWNQSIIAAYLPGMGTLSSLFNGADENALMLKVAEGDRFAFGKLYDRFSTPLYSLALKMLSSEAEAQDLLQEVFLSVWNNAASYKADRGNAFSWVVSQLRNRAIDRLRSRRRRGELLEQHGEDLQPHGSAVATSSENMQQQERAREIRAALAKLNDDQREVLELAFFEGLTQVEIAEKLEEPLGTIKARAYRGMARLRENLRYLRD